LREDVPGGTHGGPEALAMSSSAIAADANPAISKIENVQRQNILL
jgi:hypothetical protein